MAPVILVTIGVLFLLQEFASWQFGFDHTWPVMLIVIGGILLANRNASIEGHLDPAQPYVLTPQPMPAQNPPQSPSTEVHNG
jgi:membrane-bound ClpP family serine protease